MLSFLPRRRPTVLLVALLAAAVTFALFSAADPRSSATTVDPAAKAVLVFAGVDYEFELDTCFVGEDSFVVAGHGNRDDQDFRVLASPSEVELAFGVIDEATPVPEDSPWFGTVDRVDWAADQSKVTARLQLIDQLSEDAVPQTAELSIDCGTVS